MGTPYVDKITGNFSVMGKLPIRYFAFIGYWKKDGMQWVNM